MTSSVSPIAADNAAAHTAHQALHDAAGNGASGGHASREAPRTQANPAPPLPVTARLAEFAAGLSFADLPPAVVERTKLLLLDLAGIIVRSQDFDSTLSMKRALRALQSDRGTIRVLGCDERWTPQAAAHLAGAAGHSMDFDDTHARAQLHPGTPVIAAALAAAQMTGASSRQLLTGIVAGYEVMIRVALGAVALAHSERGFHPTATVGVFGAAAAAGNILGLSAEAMGHAFGTALSQSAGTGQFAVNGAWTKRFHVGYAASGGLTSAVFASQGYTGATQAFEGREGFFNVYSPRPQPELALQGLGQTWELLDTGIKPYPCCRGIHAPLDALALLQNRHALAAADVARLRVGMAQRSIHVVGEPQDRRRQPRNIVDCQFSTHLCMAVALKHGRLGWNDYEPALRDPEIFELMQRIEVFHDADCEANFPIAFSAVVEVITHRGEVFREFVRAPQGEPDTMPDAAALRRKFSQLVTPALGAQGEARLFDTIMALDRDQPAAVLFAT
ncbi:MAG: MmgE/PrpD family protein [Pigmentiphaga sp.]|nr:MmgE/PrpD family protein [Pigmentiphaga sp.]